jgi:hypothetical protein
MSILRQIRRLRPLINLEREYVVRRKLCAVLPVRARSRFEIAAHACVWKTGSQWVRLVLTDPRIYIYSGLRPIAYDRTMALWQQSPPPIPGRSLIANLSIEFRQFQSLLGGRTWSAIYVLRDPRDILVSWYFSNRYSHPPNPIVMARRAALQGLSDRDGLLATLEYFHEIGDLLEHWTTAAEQDARILILRFEDLIGQQSLETWQRALHHLDIGVPLATLHSLLALYSLKNLRGRASGGSTNLAEKYRSGRPGDWERYFDDQVLTTFNDRYRSLTERMGYGI